MRRASISWHERAILLLERGFQPALHVQQNPPLVGVSSYRTQNEVEFDIPSLPAGRYAFAIVNLVPASASAAPWRISFLLRQQPLITKVAGVFVIAMGLATLGVLRLPFLYREKRFDLNRIRSGPVGAIPLGMAFAFGWTPCIGPVLAAVFAVAANTPTASKGALLLFVYSLGMGIPFLVFAFVYSRAGRTFGAITSSSP